MKCRKFRGVLTAIYGLVFLWTGVLGVIGILYTVGCYILEGLVKLMNGQTSLLDWVQELMDELYEWVVL